MSKKKTSKDETDFLALMQNLHKEAEARVAQSHSPRDDYKRHCFIFDRLLYLFFEDCTIYSLCYEEQLIAYHALHVLAMKFARLDKEPYEISHYRAIIGYCLLLKKHTDIQLQLPHIFDCRIKNKFYMNKCIQYVNAYILNDL